ncbi:MAG: hypothetical protein WC761_04345 [Candidatus Paceibacterota bacterium]|jgi:hypothetical protein
MRFTQTWGGFTTLYRSKIEIDLMETGIDYTITDWRIGKRPSQEKGFMSYENVDNNKSYENRVHPKYTWLKGATNIGMYFNPYATALFLLTFLGYKSAAKQEMVIVGSKASDYYFSLFDDGSAEEIMDAFYKARNAYLGKKYLSGPETPTKETMDRMVSLGVIRRG